MNTKVAFAAAIILAVAAGVGMKTVIESHKVEIRQQDKQVMVAFAGRTLQAGDRLMIDHVEEVPITGRLADLGTITSSDLPRFVGQRLVQNVPRGTALKDTHFYIAPSQLPFPNEIAPKFRAKTIAVDQISGVAGLIKPRDRVDILTTLAYPAPAGGRAAIETITLLENIVVLAVDNRTDQQMALPERIRGAGFDRSGYTSITLAVLPQEARLLDLAQSQAQGRLSLTLRNPTDMSSDIQLTGETYTDTGRTSLDNLMHAIQAAVSERLKLTTAGATQQ